MANKPMPALRIPDEPEAGPSSRSSSRDPSPHGSRILSNTHGRLSKLMVPGRSRSGSGASQSETPITAYAEDGAISSGRSTPEQRRRSGKAAAASLLASDAKYKKFAAQVDKCLQSFESVNEWADFISFLSRLLKTLQTWAAYTEIPRKLIVSKRLAQCLNPALPSGVHQRALDVYAHIFSSIGVEGLRRDMLIWSSGLFPFFQFASTSVRPQIINIFQNFYLPLGEDLRPATKAIVLALLPGMEEETGDFFDKVLGFFRQLSRAVSEPFFLQTILLVLISSSASRLSALNYLAKELQKPPDPGLGVENGLIIRGVAAVLNDDNVLVRRNGLDLLLRTLRIHEAIFKEASPSERTMLTRVAIGVVLQREISLSRRVYTWLLGPDESTEKQLEYFRQNGLELLVSTLQTDMESSTAEKDANDLQRPFKIFLSLLDRWEIGSSLSEHLAIPALRAMRKMIASNADQRDELLMTAAAVYEAIEPMVIWKQLYRLIAQNLRESEVDDPTLWILESVLQKDDETLNVHVPAVLDAIISWLLAWEVRSEAFSQALALAIALIRTLPSKLLDVPEGEVVDGTLLATAIYTGKTTEDWSKRVSQETMPRIVRSIFELSSYDSSPSHMLSILQLQSILVDAEATSIQLVNSEHWLSHLLKRIANAPTFPLLEAIADLVLKARRSTVFSPPVDLTQHNGMTTILDALFSYLRPDTAPYHARCVELVWEYNSLAEIHVLEDVIASRMASTHQPTALRTFDAFGVLWRMTDDSMLPGELFSVPMFKILDTLKSSGSLHWAAEGWLRNCIGSYFRILDPILLRLLDPDSQVADAALRGAKDVDISMILYLLESLKTLVDFGGRTLSRACHASDIAKSPYVHLVEYVQSNYPGVSNHLDLVVRVLLRHIEHSSPHNPRSSQTITQIESTSLAVLQQLADLGDLSRATSTRIKQALILRLGAAVKQSQIVLQPQMLDLLRGLISTSPNLNQARNHRRNASNAEKLNTASPSLDSAKDFDNMLVDLVTQAISSSNTYPVLRQWTEFVLVLTSRLQSRADLLHALAEALSRQMTDVILRLEDAYQSGLQTRVTEEEPSLLLVSLERLMNLSMSVNPHRKSEDGRGPNEGGGILGLMSGVFVADGPANEKAATHDEAYFEDFVRSLLVTWTVIAKPAAAGPSGLSQTQCYSTIRHRAQAVLERTFKAYSLTLVEGITSIRAEDNANIDDSAIFDCIDMLTPSAQKVVELLSDSINQQLRRGSNPDPMLAALAFMEGYISRLEGPIAVQVWNNSFAFAREMLGSNTTSTSRALLYPTLRCLTTLSKTVATTSALEDRRLRRDLQEVFGKLLDVVVGSVPRLGESKAWQRRSLTESPLLANEIQGFLADEILPNLRSFLHDPDRVASACASISSSVISPAFRQNKRAPPTILRILYEMTRIPSAVKAWRLPIGEAFNDGRFFKQTADEAEAWRPLICALMDNDKDRLSEMLARITAAPSANIFANREQETITRSMNLRRLSFVLFAAEVNHYLTDLPAIQEALVDILRTNVVSPRVHSEVYRCLRVLMCRFGAQHLTNFWPVILAELFRVFEGIMDEVPPPESEPLHLILAACKFLDLLLVIQSEDFQMHQWMFVTDTTDAVYPPEDYTPEAIMDRLAEIMLEHSHLTDKAPALVIGTEGSSARRPRLAAVHAISALSQLAPFFNRASIDTYEGVYSNEGVDWEAVEDGLNGEIFDESV